jgi:hypothetical protein
MVINKNFRWNPPLIHIDKLVRINLILIKMNIITIIQDPMNLYKIFLNI